MSRLVQILVDVGEIVNPYPQVNAGQFEVTDELDLHSVFALGTLHRHAYRVPRHPRSFAK